MKRPSSQLLKFSLMSIMIISFPGASMATVTESILLQPGGRTVERNIEQKTEHLMQTVSRKVASDLESGTGADESGESPAPASSQGGQGDEGP